MLKCPKCNEKLIKIDKSFKCINNHTYDIAKQGYVNLYLKNKTNSGDNGLMVKARTAFLENDDYDFMRQNVKDKIPYDSLYVDAGCGQGYYTKEFACNAKESYGIDLSKEAILYASKQDKKTQYVVGSLFNMPFYDESIDVVTSIFVPLGQEEIHRILKKEGTWIVVGPGPKHCLELKERLYDSVYENELPEETIDGFEMVSREMISQKNYVEDIWSLLEMTPYRYKTDPKALETIRNCEGFEVTFEFIITTWRKL